MNICSAKTECRIKQYLTNTSESCGNHIYNIDVANAVLIVIMRSDVLEKLRLQTVSYSVLDPNYFAIVCVRGSN